MRLIENHRTRSAFLVLVLVSLLAGDAWRYTVGWAGFGVLVALVATASVYLLVVQRARWRVAGLPYPLIAFLVYATASIAWSFYPGATALGLAATWITIAVAVAVAVTYDWAEILRGLGLALRIALGLSVLFELFVAVLLRHPILPLVAQPGVDYANLPDKIPAMLYWSRDELFQVFDGGKVQGIFGNSTLLSYAALVGIIVFAVQLADRTVKRSWGLLWLAIAIACFVFSRSATNIVGLAAVIILVAAVLIVRSRSTPRGRAISYASIVVVVAAGLALALVFRDPLFAVLGKSPDLTHRGAIWDAVIALAQQRPVIGWGWVSYWVPWVAPFDHLAFNNGVRQLHAHNAWLDIWLQLGIVGLVVVGVLMLSMAVRSWAFAVDRPHLGLTSQGRYTALTLMPLALLTAQLVQSAAESRMLVEFGLFTVVLVAVKTKLNALGTRAPGP
jgi:exopolysaccharide production protein ExoQ